MDGIGAVMAAEAEAEAEAEKVGPGGGGRWGSCRLRGE